MKIHIKDVRGRISVFKRHYGIAINQLKMIRSVCTLAFYETLKSTTLNSSLQSNKKKSICV